ncbi:MAG: ribbon-helix-helix domain-containing protein [Burkholderiaceae bacterium]|nr:ribbon-helix-helix domain-containing protein [Burkholderiaceae bacterium]
MPFPSTADIRINARLTGADAQQFQELLDSGGVSASELLRAALREYYRLHARPKRKPLDLLADYIGAGDGPRDLSANYKSYLAQALERKMPLAAHEGNLPQFPPLTTGS